MTSTSTSLVDLGAVAEVAASCPSVLRLLGRRDRRVRVVDGVVEVHVVARWVAFLPDVADEVRAAVEPLVGSHPVTVFIDDVDDASGRAAIGPKAGD